MIRLRLAGLLEERGWTAYRLAEEAEMTLTRAYRLAQPPGEFRSITADTLERLCKALDVQPGELLEWVPQKRDRARKRARRKV